VQVTELDVEKKTIALASGETFKYDGCLLATGGKYVCPHPYGAVVLARRADYCVRSPRRLNVPGAELANIYCLRVAEEAHAIAANAEGKNLVVIGSSFIGTCLA
jgi:NADPH-dependent 2,4-dienoyl-CoA reductase/sulfur reductase-like enzyme